MDPTAADQTGNGAGGGDGGVTGVASGLTSGVAGLTAAVSAFAGMAVKSFVGVAVGAAPGFGNATIGAEGFAIGAGSDAGAKGLAGGVGAATDAGGLVAEMPVDEAEAVCNGGGAGRGVDTVAEGAGINLLGATGGGGEVLV